MVMNDTTSRSRPRAISQAKSNLFGRRAPNFNAAFPRRLAGAPDLAAISA
jgi:hypothetical protein